LSASPHVIDIPDTSGFADEEPGDTHIQPSVQKIEEHLAGFIDDDLVRIRENNDWLEVAVQASLLFTTSSTELSSEARSVLKATAQYLLEFDNPVTIEGYSDNVHVQSGRYSSNWELSSARAASVARFLVSAGIDRKRLAAVGYGENHPFKTNATPEGRAENRRVVIVVARQGNQPRNLNAKGTASAFAFIRHDEPLKLDKSIRQSRTESGGLIFTAPEEVEE
ncbi:MAG: OmpA family protein, partial [Gammaproteobacteria bacterium]|nr:OmpA family protein [Gammaproteobacteria bacterium]